MVSLHIYFPFESSKTGGKCISKRLLQSLITKKARCKHLHLTSAESGSQLSTHSWQCHRSLIIIHTYTPKNHRCHDTVLQMLLQELTISTDLMLVKYCTCIAFVWRSWPPSVMWVYLGHKCIKMRALETLYMSAYRANAAWTIAKDKIQL